MTKAFHHVGRRWILGGMLAGAASPVLARAPEVSMRPKARAADFRKSLGSNAERLIRAAGLSGELSYCLADAQTGKVLEAGGHAKALPPASVTKAITAVYALETLGPSYRFVTRLMATGPVVDGVLKGDLVLVGGGDPMLDTDQLGDMAARLRTAGVASVEGRFLYDDRALPGLRAIDPEQPDHVGYNPSLSGLNLNFNRVHFEWRRAEGGYSVTMDARAQRFRPEVKVADMQIVARDMPVYTYSDKGGRDHWTVAKGALGKGGARWLPVRRPGLYAAEVFRAVASAQGIVLPAPDEAEAAPAGLTLVENHSPPLTEILRGMLKYSTNLTAEVVGLTASSMRGKTVASLRASGREMADWAAQRLGAGTARFADHSGLGEGSEMSVSEMVKALVAVGPDGPLHAILKDVHLRDEKGRAMKSHPVKIRAKTGTLNFVSSLAGYVTTPGGKKLAFAIFSADPKARARISRADRERPKGSRSWVRRSRNLQLDLIEDWASVYGA